MRIAMNDLFPSAADAPNHDEGRNGEAAERSQASSPGQPGEGQLIGMLGHDLRCPLHDVFGFLELLSSTKLTSEQRGYLATAVAAANHLQNLLDGILDYAKAESGKAFLKEETFDLPEELEALINTFRSRAKKHNLEFPVRINSNLPKTVRLDRTKFRQVLSNILGNAIKFTHSGFVSLEADAITKSAQTHLLLTIGDSGIGIPEDQLETVFDAFRRADSKATEKVSGTGLGLAIVKQLVEAMKGHIVIESEEGYGTAISVEIPLVEITV